MLLEIISPEKEIFKGEAKSVTVPAVDGSLGILDHHAPLISTLKKGTVESILNFSRSYKVLTECRGSS